MSKSSFADFRLKYSQRYVTEDQFGDAWPLTVDRGIIRLTDGISATFNDGDTTWALNGMATSRGFPEIDPIWRDNPSLPGMKMNIKPLKDIALGLEKKDN